MFRGYYKLNFLNRMMSFFGRTMFFIFLFLTATVSAQIESVIPNAPVPSRLVNDFSANGFLSSTEIQSLENKLVAYDDSTSNQIAIVIVDQLHGFSIADYAIALGRKWGVGGQKNFNNGVVILVNTGTKDDQRGVFIATGYGMEGAVTDLVAGEIVQNNLLPNFKSGDNFRALDEATDNIIAAVAGRYTAPKNYHQKGTSGLVFFIIFIGVVVLLIIISKNGGSGGYMSRRGYTKTWGGGMPWIGGGFGGSGGGSSSGGGFGGFGGGSFGGGGAGGSW
jgi:uncharacterized protein